MLFDLRSRGRRRFVQVIYLMLALVMVSGLVLVGVGTGNGNGGLLNAFTNNGSSNGSSVSDAAVKSALKATKSHPNSASAWASLITARSELANQDANTSGATTVYTKSGLAELKLLVGDYEQYTKLVKTPSVEMAHLAANAYTSIKDWTGASGVWQVLANAEPSSSTFACVAATSYAAKDKTLGALAAAKALSLVPKLDKLELQSELTEAKTQGAEVAAAGC